MGNLNIRAIASWTTVVVASAVAGSPVLAAEGRIPIFEPVDLVAPGQSISGKYILTNDVTGTAEAPVIRIQGTGSEQVEIDLNGFTITGDGLAQEVIAVDDVASFVLRNGRVVSANEVVAAVIRVGKLTAGDVTHPVKRVLIENVTVAGGGGTGISVGSVENFTLLDNSILNPGHVGIQAKGNTTLNNTQGRIERNLIRATGWHGIEAEGGISSVVIRDNQIEGTTRNGIHAAPGSGVVVISGNAVEKSGLKGIHVNQTNSCRIEGNVIRGSGALDSTFGHGIHITSGASGCLVLNNTSSGNAMSGIHVDGARNHLDRNVMIDNGRYGLSFAAPASGNTFGRNSALGNSGSGMCGNPGPGCPSLSPPDFCDTSSGGNRSFGDNFAPATSSGPC